MQSEGQPIVAASHDADASLKAFFWVLQLSAVNPIG